MPVDSVSGSPNSDNKIREQKQVERREVSEKTEKVAEQNDNREKESSRQSIAVA